MLQRKNEGDFVKEKNRSIVLNPSHCEMDYIAKEIKYVTAYKSYGWPDLKVVPVGWGRRSWMQRYYEGKSCLWRGQ